MKRVQSQVIKQLKQVEFEIKNWNDVSAAVDKSGNKETKIVVDRDAKEKNI